MLQIWHPAVRHYNKLRRTLISSRYINMFCRAILSLSLTELSFVGVFQRWVKQEQRAQCWMKPRWSTSPCLHWESSFQLWQRARWVSHSSEGMDWSIIAVFNDCWNSHSGFPQRWKLKRIRATVCMYLISDYFLRILRIGLFLLSQISVLLSGFFVFSSNSLSFLAILRTMSEFCLFFFFFTIMMFFFS